MCSCLSSSKSLVHSFLYCNCSRSISACTSETTDSGATIFAPSPSPITQNTNCRLTRSEYAICEYLALHAGQTFTKEQIYEAVFGVDGTADDTAITQHIKNIRVKLRAAGAPETLLKTVWGVGYQWKSEN